MSSAGNEEPGLQMKSMGLKVHYTFDKDGQDRCLARHPQLINAQTFVLDESTTIGLVDIRLCLQAVSQCSPELLTGFETDYVVYAYDYSEPGAPMVGQGMLSWLLDPSRAENANQSLSMVTGRVTKNVLAIFGNGIRETLEVRLKLVQNNKVPRADPQPQIGAFSQQGQMQVGTPGMDMGLSSQPMDAGTPAAEWNFFMQSMSGFDSQSHMGSPLPMDDMSNAMNNTNPTTNAQPAQNTTATAPQPAASRAGSRPSSRASRKRQPTGRPRGRPRKRPQPEGHTSGYEDGTDGDDNPGPARKRVATTRVSDRSVSAPFAAPHDSLRVAASTSGSLRSFRPLAAAGSDGPAAGAHLQDVPRAPTPVPGAEKLGHPGRGMARGPSALGQEQSNLSQSQSQAQSFSDARLALSPEDAHSPFVAPTPAAFSEDSGGEIGSSPPVLRPSQYMQSSPPPSSPILPPMPQHDSGFMSGGVDEANYGELKAQDGCMTDAPAQAQQGNTHKEKEKDKDKVPVQYFRLQEGKGGMQDLVQVVSPYSIKPVDGSDGPRRSRGDRRGSQAGSRPSSMGGVQDAQRAGSANPNQVNKHSPSIPTLHGEQAQAPSRRGTPVPTQDQQMFPEPAQPTTTPAPATHAPSPVLYPAQPQAMTQDFHQPLATAESRQLNRSQSMGAMPVGSPRETTPAPANDDNTSKTAPPQPAPAQSKAAALPRSASFHGFPPPPAPAVPASDPVGPPQYHDFPTATSFSEAPCPPSDMMPPQTSPALPKSNKNLVKKQSIKERLERAVRNGEMPPYCSNCGAIETPTWRKVSTQDRTGVPCYYEYSEKPGHVTAIEVLERDSEERPTAYRLIKKTLGVDEDKSQWTTRILCNPCGIWLSKNNKHRPAERWAKDHERLGQERRKRGTGRNPTRRKKSANGKDNRDSLPPLTSEANAPAEQLNDGMTPEEGAIPLDHLASILEAAAQGLDAPTETQNQTTASGRSGFSNAGSEGTRGTGTANSPIAVDLDGELGSTRRLLFPSPRHKGSRDALGDVSPNIVTSGEGQEGGKEMGAEAAAAAVEGNENYGLGVEDELESLFRSPVPARPSTPPPRDAAAAARNPVLKTPSRTAGTPTHRPITRSISKTIRSVQSSPAAQLALLQTTPTRTPRSRLLPPESPSLRRSPRINGSVGRSGRKDGSDGMLGVLGGAIADEMSSQADLDAILDRCLGSWPEMAREGTTEGEGWDEFGGEWDLEALGLGTGGQTA